MHAPTFPLLESPAAINALADAFKQSRVLLTALELDVFSILDRGEADGLDAATVSAAAGADPRAMDRLLRVCHTLGLLLMPAPDRFANTPAGARHLVRGKDDFLGGLDHLNNLYRTWGQLTASVRKGGTVLDEPDMAFRDGAWFEPFMAAMYSRGRKTAPQLVAVLDLADVSSVLDVGGGPGAHAMAFARARPGLVATVFDLPQVTPITRRYLKQEGLEHAVQTRDGNFRHDALTGPGGERYDLVFLSAIVHMLSPDENRALLRKAFDATAPGGRCAVLDFVLDATRLHPPFGALFALNMLVGTSHGDTYTADEITGWLLEAGFTVPELLPAGPDTSYVVGRRPV